MDRASHIFPLRAQPFMFNRRVWSIRTEDGGSVCRNILISNLRVSCVILNASRNFTHYYNFIFWVSEKRLKPKRVELMASYNAKVKDYNFNWGIFFCLFSCLLVFFLSEPDCIQWLLRQVVCLSYLAVYFQNRKAAKLKSRLKYW